MAEFVIKDEDLSNLKDKVVVITGIVSFNFNEYLICHMDRFNKCIKQVARLV
jgi:hypothetical protein